MNTTDSGCASLSAIRTVIARIDFNNTNYCMKLVKKGIFIDFLFRFKYAHICTCMARKLEGMRLDWLTLIEVSSSHQDMCHVIIKFAKS